VYCRLIPPQDEFLPFRHRFDKTRFSIFLKAIFDKSWGYGRIAREPQ